MEHHFVTSAATAFSESAEVYLEDKKDVPYYSQLPDRSTATNVFAVRRDDPRLKKNESIFHFIFNI